MMRNRVRKAGNPSAGASPAGAAPPRGPSIEGSLRGEDRIAEVERQVHVLPVAQVVFGERETHRTDRGVIDQRRLGDIVPAFVRGRAQRSGHIVAFGAEHRIETRAEEEVGHQVEGRHHAARDETLAPEVGHVDHLRMRNRRIGRHRHQRRASRGEFGMVGNHAVDVDTQREPPRAGHVEILVPRETRPDPLAGGPRQEPALKGSYLSRPVTKMPESRMSEPLRG